MSTTLLSIFQDIDAPRVQGRTTYPLREILFLCITAILIRQCKIIKNQIKTMNLQISGETAGSRCDQIVAHSQRNQAALKFTQYF